MGLLGAEGAVHCVGMRACGRRCCWLGEGGSSLRLATSSSMSALWIVGGIVWCHGETQAVDSGGSAAGRHTPRRSCRRNMCRAPVAAQKTSRTGSLCCAIGCIAGRIGMAGIVLKEPYCQVCPYGPGPCASHGPCSL